MMVEACKKKRLVRLGRCSSELTQEMTGHAINIEGGIRAYKGWVGGLNYLLLDSMGR